jgi:hypothetical protein
VSLRLCQIHLGNEDPNQTFARAHTERLPCEVSVVHGDRVRPTRPLHLDGRTLGSRRITRRARELLWRLRGLDAAAEEDSRAYLTAFHRARWNVVLAEFGHVGAQAVDACQRSNLPLVVCFHGYEVTSRARGGAAGVRRGGAIRREESATADAAGVSGGEETVSGGPHADDRHGRAAGRLLRPRRGVGDRRCGDIPRGATTRRCRRRAAGCPSLRPTLDHGGRRRQRGTPELRLGGERYAHPGGLDAPCRDPRDRGRRHDRLPGRRARCAGDGDPDGSRLWEIVRAVVAERR